MAKKISKKMMALLMTFAMLISLMPALTLPARAVDATFTFNSGSGTESVTPPSNAQWTESGNTLDFLTTGQGTDPDSGDGLLGVSNTYPTFGIHAWSVVNSNSATEMTVTVSMSGNAFDLNSFDLINPCTYGSISYTITTSNGGTPVTVNVDANGSGNAIKSLSSADFSGLNLSGISWFEIESTATGAGFNSIAIDNLVLDNITVVAAPTVTSISPSSGPLAGGTAVVITGTNLSAASATGAVKFGATDATSYTINSPTKITATAPAGSAGKVHITVTTAGGTSATSSADQYTYAAAPTVSGISPASGPTAGSTTVIITGTNFTGLSGTSAVQFGGTNAASYTVDSDTQITATAPAGAAGTVHITVTTAGGTSATSNADKYTYDNTPPTLTTVSKLTGATEDTAYTINYSTLKAASDAADADGDAISFRVEAVSTGTLTKGGSAVTAGTTTLGTGESLVWTPAANANGDLNAFTVKAYDGTAASATAVQVVVAVSAVNDPPTVKTNAGITVNEASADNVVAKSNLEVADVDNDATAITYTLTAVPANGTLKKNSSALAVNGTFTQDDINNSRLTYTHDGSETTSDSFKFTVSDGTANISETTFAITVTPVNDAPTLTTVSKLTGATEDTAYTIDYSALKAASDAADADGDPIKFRVEAVSTGTLTKSGSAVTAGTTTLGTGESLVWTPAANANGDLNAFTVKAYDGTAASTTAVQVVVAVSAVNDPPTGKPTVSGTASVGSELTSSTTAMSDADGLGSFGYKWQVSANGTDGWSDIAANSTSDKYTVTSNEAGKYVRVAVSYTDGGGTAETVYSDAFGPNKTSQTPLVYADLTKTYGAAAFTYTATGGSGSGAVSYTSSDTSVATIDASTGAVTIKKAGSTTLTVTRAGDATYTSATKSCVLTVDKAVLTATVGDYTKHYGDLNPSFTVSVTGFVNNETAETLAGADYTAPTASCSADTTTDVGTSSITISGGVATNYTFNKTDTGTLTINPKALTYDTVTANNREYDGTTDSTGTLTLNGVINGDKVTASGTFAFETAGVENGKIVNVTGITLSGTDSNNYYYATLIPTSTTANITKKPISVSSVTIAGKTYNGDTTATISGMTLSGVVGTEDVSVDYTGATAAFNDAGVGDNKTVTVSGALALKGAAKDNYSLSNTLPSTITGNITAAGKVPTPQADVTGAIAPETNITLSCSDSSAVIYYTTDGKDPKTYGTKYDEQIAVDNPITIKAIAIRAGYSDSNVMSESYTISPEVTAHNSTELANYISSTYVSTINLVKTGDYTYNGGTISRPLTINGNGATIKVGTGIDGTVVKMTSGAVANATGKVLLEVSGSLLTINDVTLQNDPNDTKSSYMLSAINVKTGGSLYLDGVSFKDFYGNPACSIDNNGKVTGGGAVNNFGVHAEPLASSTTVTNCTFDSSNAFRNAVAIRGGTAVITNNTFVGSDTPNRLNKTDGNEYAVYLYGGTSTVTGNDMSGYDSRLAGNYLTSAICTAPYYDISATITGNSIHGNMCGINLVGSWHTLSSPAVATVNGTALTNSANAFAIGKALAAQNTLSGNAQGGIQLGLDQNDYYTDTRNSQDYGTPIYCSDFLSLASQTSSSATLSFASFDSALSFIANQKANSLLIEVSADNGSTWTNATTSSALGTSSTGATVTLASGKTYLLRAKLIISSVIRAAGSAETPVVYGDMLCYSNAVTVTIATPAAYTPTTQTTKVVEVDGVKQDAGTSKTETVSGKVQETITVDAVKLDKLLESSGTAPTVTLPGNAGSDVVVGALNGQTVKNMEQKEAVLEVSTSTVTYTLPASQINIDSVSAQMGSAVALKDISVSVSISAPPAGTVNTVMDTASRNGYQVVVKPVDFEISCTSGGKTVEVSKFNGYVERTVAIPDGVDPSKITTGIVLNADGSFSHVPTLIVKNDGKYYAKINSLTNSTYSVIWHTVTFADAETNWAKSAINDMGSRLIVTGDENGKFNPDRSITRAEFAAIAVRALGLTATAGQSGFNDVSADAWFSGYVKTASTYGLITGYGDGSFRPGDTITREQAMAILARAMKLTKLTATSKDTSALLEKYTDSASASIYAKDSIAACISTGVITGTSGTTISPKDDITRAQVAAAVQRLLQKSNLI